ncbi:unnamed protein product [Anisakis simplex]|uniref:Uncharacterized protein n=1 Tax=Anisakis simplex TaxID=6269 RepID=A0A0M3K1B2_ANISI|nr:unnamed protein product [Anisakis simplex]
MNGGNWTTRGVGGVSSDSYLQQGGGGGGLFDKSNNRQKDRYDSSSSYSSSGGGLFGGPSCSCSSGSYGGLFGRKALTFMTASKLNSANPNRILLKCDTTCFIYVNGHCPHKLELLKLSARRSQPVTGKRNAWISSMLKQEHGNIRLRARNKFPASTASQIGGEPLKVSEMLKVSGDAMRITPNHFDIPVIKGDANAEGSGELQQSNIHNRCVQNPPTAVSNLDIHADCGTQLPSPPCSPCLPRRTVDDMFCTCCQQYVPLKCHSLCIYTYLRTAHEDICGLEYLSAILHYASRNQDNRNYCRYLDCGCNVRRCNVGESVDRASTLEEDDVVCLGNWNVIMYCARAGINIIY